MCGPGVRGRKWRLSHESRARGGDEEEQSGAEGAVEEGHPTADPAAANGE